MSNNIEAIKEAAIDATEKETGRIRHLDWATALNELENAVINYINGQESTIDSPIASKLLRLIDDTGEFMIALVFNREHTKVTALPIPVPFDSDTRRLLVTNEVPTYKDMSSVASSVKGMLMDQRDERDTIYILSDVIMLKQNLDEDLNVGYWNPQEAKIHENTKLYDAWIQRASQEMK